MTSSSHTRIFLPAAALTGFNPRIFGHVSGNFLHNSWCFTINGTKINKSATLSGYWRQQLQPVKEKVATAYLVRHIFCKTLLHCLLDGGEVFRNRALFSAKQTFSAWTQRRGGGMKNRRSCRNWHAQSLRRLCVHRCVRRLVLLQLTTRHRLGWLLKIFPIGGYQT